MLVTRGAQSSDQVMKPDDGCTHKCFLEWESRRMRHLAFGDAGWWHMPYSISSKHIPQDDVLQLFQALRTRIFMAGAYAAHGDSHLLVCCRLQVLRDLFILFKSRRDHMVVVLEKEEEEEEVDGESSPRHPAAADADFIPGFVGENKLHVRWGTASRMFKYK